MVEDKRINVNGLMVSEDFLFRYIGALHNEKTKLKKKVEELDIENKRLSEQIMKRDYFINDLAKENYMLQCEQYNSFEEYLEKEFEKRKEIFEVE